MQKLLYIVYVLISLPDELFLNLPVMIFKRFDKAGLVTLFNAFQDAPVNLQ